MSSNLTAFQRLRNTSLVLQIVIGIIAGVALASFSPSIATSVSFVGDFFVSALKAVAPILVFILVISAIANQRKEARFGLKPVIHLYLVGTLLASITAVLFSYIFPTQLILITSDVSTTPPEGILEVLNTLLFKIVDNPVNSLVTGNFIGILAWAIGFGLALQHANESTKNTLQDFADAVSKIVRLVIRLAPIGIFGLVATTFAQTGFAPLIGYSHLLAVLIGCMVFIALVVNPILVYIKLRTNPYPLVLQCLRESGVTAFFTRSSAANIPVNMALCEKLGLDKDTYSVSIPLGATINMAGAAITITVLTLAAVNTLGIEFDIFTAILLSVVAAISACGASGVAGGSLSLIPLACSLFGVPNEIAMQVVAIGFIIGVVQDSAETALNSSTDVIFTTAACRAQEKEQKK